MVGFIFGGNTGLNYEDLQNRRAAADALAKRIMGQQPKNVGEGIGALLQGAAAGIGKYKADKGLREGREQASTQFNDILSRITGQPVTAAGSATSAIPTSGASAEIAATSPAAGNGSYRDAIASIESAGSGDYSAIGPTNSKLGRPLGRYQIMEANIPAWSKEALGREVTADEFLKNPELQDKVFDHKFQGYVSKFGPEGAAQAWLGGPGSVGKTNRKDVLGTSVGEYGSRFMNALGPQQVASLDPSAGMLAPQTAAQAIETQAPMQGGSLSDEVADWRQTPEAQAQFPGRQAQAAGAPAFDVTRFGAPALTGLEAGLRSQAAAYGATSQQPNAAPGGARPVEVASSAPPAPVAPQQAAPTNPAQTQPAQAQPYQIDPQVLQFLSSPFADEGQKQSVRMMLQQQMQAHQQAQEEQTWRARQDYASQQQQNDPLRQAQIAEANAQVRALQNPTRPITDEERQAWGITDNRPYAMTPKGPEPIGGSGQTINFRSELDARRQAASELGIDPSSEEGKRYILTGSLPAGDRGVTAGDREAIRDADDQIQAAQSAMDQLRSIVTPGENGKSLNDRAGSGAMADWQSWAARNDPTGFFDDAKGEATTELNNTVLGQALGSLKSIFGAAPTEGERQILLDMQASVDKTPAERKIIIDKAMKLAERRMQFNQDRATDLRGGTYYKSNRGAEPNVQTNPPLTADEATGMPPSRQDNSAVAHPTTDAEFNALPSGARYIDPDDGQQYRKP